MSLIVVRKQESKIFIVGDTKLSAPDGQEYSKVSHLDAESSVIKSTIINPLCCVSFAGNSVVAEEALKKIAPESAIEEINGILLSSHLAAGQVTDYISCVIDNCEPHIYEIKKGSVDEVEAAWIGSQVAFHRFQSYMLGERAAPQKQNVITINRAESGDLLHRMTAVIDYLIEDEDIPEVAGFKIRVLFDGKRFVYEGYLDSYFASQQLNFIIPPNAGDFRIPITHGSAAAGAYTVNFFNSYTNTDCVGLHIKQGNFGVLYSRSDGGLLRPKIFERMDELDFLDCVESKYQIGPTGLTQDAFIKFGTEAKALADKGNYREAIATYTKGVNYLYNQQKARFYFNIAICFIHLNQIPDAIQNFNQAVQIDFSLQGEATRIMQQVASEKWRR